jgi:hypothetical protein
MFATLITVALLLAPAIQGVVADFTMDTPELTQCQEAHITWDKTTGPYNLIVVHSDDPCGDPIADLGDHAGPSMSWNVSILAGSQVELSVLDAGGDEAWSGVITVGASTNVSCLSPTDLASLKNATASTLKNATASTPTLSAASTTPNVTSNTKGAGAINNAGSNPSNSTASASASAALTVRHISGPVLAMSAFIGATLLL